MRGCFGYATKINGFRVLNQFYFGHTGTNAQVIITLGKQRG